MRRVFLFIVCASGLSAISLFLLIALLPTLSLDNHSGQSSLYYDKNGRLLRFTLANDDRYRLRVPLEAISPRLKKAVVLYEDKNFYDHIGVDFSALFRAFFQTYITNKRRIGASTITMQVARIRFDINTRTIFGKLKQIFYALRVDWHYDKNRILRAYFNLLPYGGNIEGAAAAALIYFDKPAIDLNLSEALLLAVVPQNPSKRNPQSASGQSASHRAKQRLFKRWLEYYPEDISKQHYIDTPIYVRSPRDLPFKAPHFVNRLRYESPLRHGAIETTLDLAKQKLIERHIRTHVKENSVKGVSNAAALLLNHQTMEIEAWVGSANFFNKTIMGQVDGVTSKRSPGSTLKPFIYALAMDQGIIHPSTLMKDAPHQFGGYSPENFDKQFLGPVSATQALITSRNVPAVYLQSQLSQPGFYDFLKKTNIGAMKEKSHYGLSLGLGGMEVTMLELVRLYAMLANYGRIYHVKKIKGEHMALNIDAEQQALSPEAAFLTMDMLSKNPGFSSLPALKKRDNRKHIAWKTGTSYAFRDAWSVGIFGPYVLAVWVGNFDGQGNANLIGRRVAGPLFFRIANSLLSKNETIHLVEHMQNKARRLNIKKVDICTPTGSLPSKFCPETKKEWFIPGVSPIKTGTIYRPVFVYKKSGLRACEHSPPETSIKIYPFWPSDIRNIFRRAGMMPSEAPKFEKPCDMEVTGNKALSPAIRSPLKHVVYYLKAGPENIPFQATLDADASAVHWFVDDRYIGSNASGAVTLWMAEPGNFTVRAVDDNGLSDVSQLRVKNVAGVQPLL